MGRGEGALHGIGITIRNQGSGSKRVRSRSCKFGILGRGSSNGECQGKTARRRRRPLHKAGLPLKKIETLERSSTREPTSSADKLLCYSHRHTRSEIFAGTEVAALRICANQAPTCLPTRSERMLLLFEWSANSSAHAVEGSLRVSIFFERQSLAFVNGRRLRRAFCLGISPFEYHSPKIQNCKSDFELACFPDPDSLIADPIPCRAPSPLPSPLRHRRRPINRILRPS